MLSREEKHKVVETLKKFVNARQGLYTIGKSIGIDRDRIQEWLLEVNPMRNWYCCAVEGELALIRECEEKLLEEELDD